MTNDKTGNYILRPQMMFSDIRWRDSGRNSRRRKALKNGLITLHNLELMATTIYAFQLTKTRNEHNRRLISALCNEASHYSDFSVKLREYGFQPSKLRWFWCFVGAFFGLGSHILGPRMILRTGIWVETKAVHHYGELLDNIDWDAETRKMIEKDRDDEGIHIEHWKDLSAELKKEASRA